MMTTSTYTIQYIFKDKVIEDSKGLSSDSSIEKMKRELKSLRDNGFECRLDDSELFRISFDIYSNGKIVGNLQSKTEFN